MEVGNRSANSDSKVMTLIIVTLSVLLANWLESFGDI